MDKCTRCNRSLKQVHIVDGQPYGPVCVVKLFGAAPPKQVSASRRKPEEHEEVSTQLPFFEEDLSS